MPRTIAYIDHAVETGGAQKSLTELLVRLDPARYEPVLLHSTGAAWVQAPELDAVRKIAVFKPGGVFNARRDQLSALTSSSNAIAAAWAIRRVLAKIDPALVHTNAPKSHFIGGLAARMARKPVIWHVRDIMEGKARSWVRRFARGARPQIIAISQAVADQFAGLHIPLSVIYNGVPLERFAASGPNEALRTQLGLASDTQIVLTVGRLTPWKGHRTLLSAFARVCAQQPDVALLIAGNAAFWEPSYADDLRRLADELGIGQKVQWLGERADVPELLRVADVFCLPSVNEPFGRAIAEAMAAGNPIVACRSGGTPEVVAEGKTGVLVPDDSVEELAAALMSLLRDPVGARQMGQAGRQRAEALFDINRVAAEVQALYDKMLG